MTLENKLGRAHICTFPTFAHKATSRKATAHKVIAHKATAQNSPRHKMTFVAVAPDASNPRLLRPADPDEEDSKHPDPEDDDPSARAIRTDTAAGDAVDLARLKTDVIFGPPSANISAGEPGFTGPPPPDGYDAYARGLVAADDRRRDINVVHLHAAPARPVVVRRVPYAVPVAVHDLLDDDAAVDWGRARRAASATRASKARAARARATAEAARRAAESDADAAEEHAAKAKRARRSASAARTAAATAAVVASAKAKKARKRSKTPRGRKSKKTPLTKRRPKKSGKKA